MNDWKESDWFKLWLAMAKEKPEEETALTVNRPTTPSGCDIPDPTPATEWELTE
jgi:hypothetical protein